jgi:hypothetical protein
LIKQIVVLAGRALGDDDGGDGDGDGDGGKEDERLTSLTLCIRSSD